MINFGFDTHGKLESSTSTTFQFFYRLYIKDSLYIICTSLVDHRILVVVSSDCSSR
jgi:hypothetical protein